MFGLSSRALRKGTHPVKAVREKRNFRKHLVGIIFEDPIKVRCQDKHSHVCSKGQGVRGVRLGAEEKLQLVWKIFHLLQNAAFRTSPKEQS